MHIVTAFGASVGASEKEGLHEGLACFGTHVNNMPRDYQQHASVHRDLGINRAVLELKSNRTIRLETRRRLRYIRHVYGWITADSTGHPRVRWLIESDNLLG